MEGMCGSPRLSGTNAGDVRFIDVVLIFLLYRVCLAQFRERNTFKIKRMVFQRRGFGRIAGRRLLLGVGQQVDPLENLGINVLSQLIQSLMSLG